MTFFDIFGNLANSLPSKVMLAMGVGWISFEGYKVLIDNLISELITNYNSIPSTMYQLLSLAGFTDGLGVILGAFAAKGAIYGVKVLGNVAL